MGDLQQDRVLLPEKGVFIMVHGTAVLKSEYDGLGLSVLWVVPGEGSRGVVQISHGMSENKERYLPFMEYLAKRGYDLKKEREEWYKRVKARGGTL